MKTSFMASVAASPFAHLLGFSRPAGARAEEDDDDHKEDAARAEDSDDEDDDKKDGKKSKKAKGKARSEDDSDDDDEPGDDKDQARAEDSDDEDDDKKDSKKSKKAKADDDEECDDEDDDMAKGRKAERARWAKVLKSPAAAGGRVAAACEMLANTGMSANAVISTLSALPVASASGLRERMSGVPKHDLGDDASATAKPGLAAQIVAAGKRRRGEK